MCGDPAQAPELIGWAPMNSLLDAGLYLQMAAGPASPEAIGAERALVDAARHGDERAFRALVEPSCGRTATASWP
jgi:hypothetical protein